MTKQRNRSTARAAAAACPCGSGRSYSGCCAPLHRGESAPTAEALMRSRYSAYVKLLPTYLLRTWDPRTRPEDLTFEPGLRWTGLEVLGTEAGGEMDQFGTVEFLARHEIAGTPGALHEVSRFVRVDGRWAYLDGTH